MMAKALKAEGIELTHIIGPKTKHRLSSRQPSARSSGGSTASPSGAASDTPKCRFPTYTLKYNRTNWVTIDALGEHWEQAQVRAALIGAGPVS